jgi:asparagine synthase (glutamine-hydrolysing)
MCGIAGIVSQDERELGPLLKPMLIEMQHRGPDGAGFVIGSKLQRGASVDDLDFFGEKSRFALGHVRLAITGGKAEYQPFRSGDGRLSLLHNGEIYNYHELAKELDIRLESANSSDSEVVLRLLEQEYDGDLTAAMRRVLPRLDGVYALAVTDGEQTICARDRIGVRQLYYYESAGMVAFASEKKTLMELGGDNVQIKRILPGEMLIFTGKEHRLEKFWKPDDLRTVNIIRDRDKALKAYDKAIRAAVHKRVENRERVGIIYSGGIDSYLIAYLTQQEGVPFTCYTAGKEEGSSDVAWAEKTAAEAGFPIMIRRLSADDIAEMLPDVISSIEDHSLNQVEVAVPVFASVRMAAENGERVIMNGQGADELFGGYPWYRKIINTTGEGYDEFVRRSWEDAFLLYKECLEREDKIAMAHSIELRVPFLDPEVIKVAFQIAPELKIPVHDTSYDKRIHREYCEWIGVPKEIAFRGKEAAQHGANVHNVFDELAARLDISEHDLAVADYDPNLSVTEKLGSSSRYGYKYGDADKWKPRTEVQYYLDTVAAEHGTLTKAWKYQWARLQERLSQTAETV